MPDRLEPGDIPPRYVLPSTDGLTVDLLDDSIAGNSIALLLIRRAGAEALEWLVAADGRAREFAICGCRLFVVLPIIPENLPAIRSFPILIDDQSRVFTDFGLSGDTAHRCVVIRPNYHIFDIGPAGKSTPVEWMLAAAQRLAQRRRTVLMESHPPVLVVPDVLSKSDCERLINVFNTRGKRFVDPGTGFDRFGADYKMRIPEYGRKDRIDHWIFDKDTCEFLDQRLQRVWPEILKAFQYKVTKKEALRIGAYKGERGGARHGHRDNVPPTTYRKFAMSINLNTEKFEGGEIRFPEFGDQRYRPESGHAVIFSSSLLHEAMHVTAGRRFVLLAFLFGDDP
jgi:2-oxoglutarate-Fe(II)-dependent oxygenase superfamily protein